MAVVRVTLNQHQIHELTNGPAGPVVRMMEKVTRRATNAMKVLAPVDTGVGRASIRSEVSVTPTHVTGEIFMARHMWYQARGTGIYGPFHRPIRPKNGRFLRFEASRTMGPLRAGQQNAAPGKRGIVYAREVKGTPKNHFLRDAVSATVPWPVRYHDS